MIDRQIGQSQRTEWGQNNKVYKRYCAFILFQDDKGEENKDPEKGEKKQTSMIDLESPRK